MKYLSFFLIFIFPLNYVDSQTQPKTVIQEKNILNENDSYTSKESSDYLEKHIISKKISNLKEKVEKNLRKLGKIIKNYENELQDSKKKFEEAFQLYKTGVENYYAGNLINAYNQFLKSKNVSNELLFEFSKIYKKKVTEIATTVASKISNLEEDNLNASYFLIQDASHRLTVIKNKIDNAQELIRFHQYSEAIDLYRNAKILGILSLYQLEQDKNKKEEILNQFKTDLEDANYKMETIKLESF